MGVVKMSQELLSVYLSSDCRGCRVSIMGRNPPGVTAASSLVDGSFTDETEMNRGNATKPDTVKMWKPVR